MSSCKVCGKPTFDRELCIQCHKEATREHKRDYHREWMATHPGKGTEYTMRWRYKHPAMAYEYQREYRIRKQKEEIRMYREGLHEKV